MARNEIQHRDYRVVQVTPDEIAGSLRCDEFEAANRTSVGGMKLPVVYIVRDEFDACPLQLDLWFESPLTAKAAIDIHCYGEGFQRGSFWPNYHDVYIAMRNCPQLLQAFQRLHRAAVRECEDNIEITQDDFAFKVREQLGRLFTEMEFNTGAIERAAKQGG